MLNTEQPKRDTLLLVLVALTAAGAIPSAIALLMNPSGANLGLSPDLLAWGPFSDFLIPGIVLLTVFGLGGVPVALGLWRGAGWARKSAFAYGVLLLGWVTVQALVMGIISPLQPVFGTVGLLICARALSLQIT